MLSIQGDGQRVLPEPRVGRGPGRLALPRQPGPREHPRGRVLPAAARGRARPGSGRVRAAPDDHRTSRIRPALGALQSHLALCE